MKRQQYIEILKGITEACNNGEGNNIVAALVKKFPEYVYIYCIALSYQRVFECMNV